MFSGKSIESYPAMGIGFAESGDHARLGDLQAPRLAVGQQAICLSHERDKQQVAKPAKKQVLNVGQRRSRSRIAEGQVER